jgi:DNA-binding NarL/FixJ family response regulator
MITPLFREGVKALLAEETDLVVAGEAGTAKETLQRVRHEDFDVLLLDISLPDGSGIDLLRQIRPHKPNLRSSSCRCIPRSSSR